MRMQLLNIRTLEHQSGGAELVDVWRTDSETILWADYEAVSLAERESHFEGAFGLHKLAVDDALRERHPPKCEHFEEHLFTRIRGLDERTDDIDFRTLDISLFLRSRLLVTRRTGHSINTEALWQEVLNEPRRLRQPEQLALTLIGRVVRRYVAVLLDLEPRLEELESEVFIVEDDSMLKELTRYKSRLKQLRRIFQYHLMVLTTLQSRPITQDSDSADRLMHEAIDVHDQVQRGLSLSELYYELTSDLVDAFLAMSSHRLNKVMQILTIVTVIFVPLGLLAGIYGMNFEIIPELKIPWGYYALLGTMAAIATTQLVFFRKRGWL